MEQQYTFERVMIIDDNEVDRYTVAYVMKKNFFAKETLDFDMATKALDYLEKNQHNFDLLPEIIILDINMPEMDGFQFMEHLTHLPNSIKQSCCIVMLSSSIDPMDQQRAEANPVIKKFLNKPLKKTDLERIRKFYIDVVK